MNNFELRETGGGADESHDIRHGKFTVSRVQAVLFVLVAMVLIAITGILVAMFGPGSPDLKYHETVAGAYCEGLESRKKDQTTIWCSKGKMSLEALECDVAILGGGLSGLFMAESLLRNKKEKVVCVFEKEDRFGGRIFDHRFFQVPKVNVGLGALRVSEGAKNMINLMERFNISHGDFNYNFPNILESRGVFANSSTEIKKNAFPTLNRGMFKNMTSVNMTIYALRSDHVATSHLFATWDAYVSHYLTPEGAEFLSELYGYKGDFTESINPTSFIEYFQQLSVSYSGSYQRPVTGVSAFIEELVASVKKLGGKLYKNNAVFSINTEKSRFSLVTCDFNVSAKKAVIATHPVAFMRVKGSVASQIQQHAEFQSIQVMPALKGAAVYSEAWWEESAGANLALIPRQGFISNSNCLGLTLPYGERGPNGEAVLQTMYVDGACSKKWGDVLKISKSVMDREVKRALEYKFRRAVPDPLDTVYQYWEEGAWHYQKPAFNFTLSQVSDWARRPLKGQEIFVIGDAYNPIRGWTEGAILSAQNALKEGWGIPKPSSKQEGQQRSRALNELFMDFSIAFQHH